MPEAQTARFKQRSGVRAAKVFNHALYRKPIMDIACPFPLPTRSSMSRPLFAGIEDDL